MPQFVEGRSTQISNCAKRQLFSYRHKVFVEHLGWGLETELNLEKDEFDHDHAVYVMAKNNDNDIVGCARLLPTTQPYLLEKIFPELLNGMPPPKECSTWELSRFTSMDLSAKQSITAGQPSSASTAGLLKKSIEVAKNYGAKRLISVSPVGIERLMRKMDLTAHRAGPPKIIDGFPLVACWLELDK